MEKVAGRCRGGNSLYKARYCDTFCTAGRMRKGEIPPSGHMFFMAPLCVV
jgi:hypothetical protein